MVNHTFLISGATSGMGNAFLTLAKERKDKVIAIVRPECSHLIEENVDQTILFDYSKPENIDDAFRDFNQPITAFINFAGILPGKTLFEQNYAGLKNIFDINLLSPMLVIQKVESLIKKNGVLVLLGSISGEKGSYDDAYAVTKGGIHTLVKSLALKFAPEKRVVGIAPGMTIPSRMTSELVSGRYEETMKNKIPLQRPGNAKDVAELIYFVCSDACSFMTGNLIDINGGQYLR